MSERITAANLDEVIKRNEVIEEQMKQSASLIWSKYNPMQINSPIQLALQILRPWPSHYRFLYNRKMKQIAVQACGAEESGAHRVGKPDESNSGEIKCMALVRMIYGDSGWDKKMSYRLIGRAFPQQRLVSFKITDAMQIENGRVLTEM